MKPFVLSEAQQKAQKIHRINKEFRFITCPSEEREDSTDYHVLYVTRRKKKPFVCAFTVSNDMLSDKNIDINKLLIEATKKKYYKKNKSE